MSTKSELLRMLETARGEFLSGEQLATGLGISRAAVWKAIESLRKEGLAVESQPGGGYRLAAGADLLSAEGIQAAMGRDVPLRVLREVDSTNLEGKRWALEDAPHGALVCAQTQTGGRGRLGRSFQSPPGGAYLSIVLRPKVDISDAVLVTAQAAVAACDAVAALCGIELGIKWVNDLFVRGRKCCGILSEASTDFETGTMDYIVVGIGINYTTPQSAFPKELREIVTGLYPAGGAPVTRNVLVAGIYTRLMDLFHALPDKGFMEEYRRRSIVLGKQVTVLADEPYKAKAVEIDGQARLVVDTEAGRRVLSSGEISVKL